MDRTDIADALTEARRALESDTREATLRVIELIAEMNRLTWDGGFHPMQSQYVLAEEVE